MFGAAAEKVLPSVVQIKTESEQPRVHDAFEWPSSFGSEPFDEFFGDGGMGGGSSARDSTLGCGVIVDASGIVDLEGTAGIGEGMANWRRTLTPWDAVDDGRVDLLDMAAVAAAWTRSDCSGPDWCGGGDVTRNGTVDVEDLRRLAEYWMEPVE